MRSKPYFKEAFLLKLLVKAVAAMVIITKYWIMVTVFDAQKSPSASCVKVRLHCSMFTAYFWKGKMAE